MLYSFDLSCDQNKHGISAELCVARGDGAQNGAVPQQLLVYDYFGIGDAVADCCIGHRTVYPITHIYSFVYFRMPASKIHGTALCHKVSLSSD